MFSLHCQHVYKHGWSAIDSCAPGHELDCKVSDQNQLDTVSPFILDSLDGVQGLEAVRRKDAGAAMVHQTHGANDIAKAVVQRHWNTHTMSLLGVTKSVPHQSTIVHQTMMG